jgi:peptidoglycan/LPS O-acetylase OafA/YrhL
MNDRRVDGLRGLAALNVTISHFVLAFFPLILARNYPSIFKDDSLVEPSFKVLTSPIFSIFFNGHFAVLIFFVLSGYVLTLPFYERDVDFRSILKRRLKGRYIRLNIPIAVAVFTSFLFYKWGFYLNVTAAELSGSQNWLKNFFPQDMTFVVAIKEALYQSILLGDSLLVPQLWTLKIEFIGSIYLLIFYIFSSQKIRLLQSVMVCCLIYFVHRENSIYYFAIFGGSLFGQAKNFDRFKIIFFVMGFYLGGFQYHSVVYDALPDLSFLGEDIWEKKTFYNTLGALFLTFSVIQGIGARLWESRPFQFLGRISYALYLCHFIVLCSLSAYLYVHLPLSKPFFLVNLLVYLTMCFLISFIFEKTVDRWAVKLSRS